MKQIDNRQKELIQLRAQRALKEGKGFALKEKDKGTVHLPSGKSVKSGSEAEKENDSKSAVYHAGPKVGRNDPCPCGSGKKYKKCCINSQLNK